MQSETTDSKRLEAIFKLPHFYNMFTIIMANLLPGIDIFPLGRGCSNMSEIIAPRSCRNYIRSLN